jgi:hypothetical protein
MSSKFQLPPFFLLLICTLPSLLSVVVVTPFVCNHEKDGKEQHKGEAPPAPTLFRLLVDDENHGDREGSSLPLLFLTIGALNVVMFFSPNHTHPH